MAKYKVAFDNSGFKDKEVDNVNRVQASSDLMIMRDDKGEVLFAAPMNQIRYVEMIQPEAVKLDGLSSQDVMGRIMNDMKKGADK